MQLETRNKWRSIYSILLLRTLIAAAYDICICSCTTCSSVRRSQYIICIWWWQHPSREQNYTLKVQFSTFHWSVKPLLFSSFKCSGSTLLGVWKSARCTSSRAVHLKLENKSGFALAALLHLRTFALLCTSPLALNVHFCSVLRLCTFGKVTLPRPVHFCKAFMFALWALLRFVRFCTYALSS